MSFLSDIVNFGKTAVGLVSGTGIFSTLARTAILGYAVNRLSKRASFDAALKAAGPVRARYLMLNLLNHAQ